MRKMRGIIYALDTVVAVETSAILVSGLFGNMAVWQKWFVMIAASVAVWRMIIAVEKAILRKGKNEEKGKRSGSSSSVSGTPWHAVRFYGTKPQNRHPSRYTPSL